MHSLLLKTDVFANLVDMLHDTGVIFAIIITVVGITLAAMAGPIASAVKKKKVSSTDNLKITIKIIALILILIGLVVMIIPTLIILING